MEILFYIIVTWTLLNENQKRWTVLRGHLSNFGKGFYASQVDNSIVLHNKPPVIFVSPSHHRDQHTRTVHKKKYLCLAPALYCSSSYHDWRNSPVMITGLFYNFPSVRPIEFSLNVSMRIWIWISVYCLMYALCCTNKLSLLGLFQTWIS